MLTFIRAENRERGYKNWIAGQAEELANKDAELAAQKAELANKDAELVAQKAELANKDAILAEITAELAKLREENESLKSKISKI